MEELFELAEKLYSAEDVEKIKKAYAFAKKAHEGQKRESGESYIIHPEHVAIILMQMGLDATAVQAGLLHDVVEDTPATHEEITAEFGEEVSEIVRGVTKLTRISFASKQVQQAENLRRMFLAMAQNISVILVKLADRLHNMRTLGNCEPAKQRSVARETLDIYAPLANRLGIYQIKWELEDLCLRYLEPEAYKEISDAINQKRDERAELINSIIAEIKEKLDAAGMQAHIYGRAKHFYSIYKKMKSHNVSIDQVYDITAIRIIVGSIKDCYEALGIIHSEFRPMPGRFKDYIAMPKVNNYQSLHTTVIGTNGKPFEVQIRTEEMHNTAEYGIAAHWKYKEGMLGGLTSAEERLSWIRKMLDFEHEAKDSVEFIDAVKTELFNDEVFVFTPKSDVISLAMGSTPLDFAYSIHSAIGHRCIGAKVNGKIVNLDYKLKTGDIVEVLTASAASGKGPSRDWLNIVRTNEAKAKIKQWFKKELREENIEKGRDMLEKEARRLGYSLSSLMRSEWLEPFFDKYQLQSNDDLYASVGYGGLSTHQILPKLVDNYRQTVSENEVVEEVKGEVKQKNKSTQGIFVKGESNMLVRFARCCSPVPGDDIVGYITRGRGVSVHRRDCKNLADFEKEREIGVEWDLGVKNAYIAGIKMLAYDRAGILMDVSNGIYSADLHLISINAQVKEGVAAINMMIEITSAEQLEKVLRQLKKISGVIEVYRFNM